MVRFKARYILFSILYPNTTSSTPTPLDFLAPSPSLTPSELAKLIRDSLTQQFGDYGGGNAGNLSIKYFSPVTSTGILRVARENYRLVWAALTYVKEIQGRPVVIRVVRVSGTIKKAEVEAVRRAKVDIERMRGLGEKEKIDVLASIMGGGSGGGLGIVDQDDGEEDEEMEG